MGARRRSDGYFSCPWTSYVMLMVTLLQAVVVVFQSIDTPIILSSEMGFDEKTTNILIYVIGFSISALALIINFITENCLGRFKVMVANIVFLAAGLPLVVLAITDGIKGHWYSLVMYFFGLGFLNISDVIQRRTMPTFIADQFEPDNYPPEAKERMFSWSYMLLNIAALTLLLLIQFLVKDVRDHFFIAMGAAGLSAVFFLSAWKWFFKAKCKQNVLVDAIKCIHYGIHGSKEKQQQSDKQKPHNPEVRSSETSGSGKQEGLDGDQTEKTLQDIKEPLISNRAQKESKKEDTFLHKAYPRFDWPFIADVAQVLKVTVVLVVGIPYSLCLRGFHTLLLFQTQSSNHQLGPFFISYYMCILMITVVCVGGVLLTNVLFNPLFKWLSKKGKVFEVVFKVSSIPKMGVGSFFVAVAFIFAVIARIQIDNDSIGSLEKPSWVIFWGHHEVKGCSIKIGENLQIMGDSDKYKEIHIENGAYFLSSNCSHINKSVEIKPGVNVFALFPNASNYSIDHRNFHYSRWSNAVKAMASYQLFTCQPSIDVTWKEEDKKFKVSEEINYTYPVVGRKPFTIVNKNFWEETLEIEGKHGAYTILFEDTSFCSRNRASSPKGTLRKFEVIPPHSVSIFWAVLENVVIGLAEITLAVGAMEFAYSQTAPSMKTFMQGMWGVTSFFGDLIGILITSTTENLMLTTVIQAAIAVAGLVYFFVVSMYVYKYKDMEETDESETGEENEEKGKNNISESSSGTANQVSEQM